MVSPVEKSRSRYIKRKCQLSKRVKKPEKVKKTFQHSTTLWDVNKQSASHTEVLSYQNRTIVPIQPDGNCFFQALSSVLYGHQDKHQEFCNQLVHLITSRKETYRKFMFSVLPLEGHLEKMANCGTWAKLMLLLVPYVSMFVHKG